MKKNKIIATSLLGLLAVSTLTSVNVNANPAGTAGSKGSVSFDANGGQTPTPVDPTDPKVPPAEIEPSNPGEGGGTSGLLRFDRVPNLAFASIPVSNKEETVNVLEEKYKLKGGSKEFYAAPTIEVTDISGKNTGWSIRVKVDDTFVDKTDSTSTFKGQIKMQQGRVASYSGQDSSLFPTTPTGVLEIPQASKASGDGIQIATAAKGNGAYQWGISYYTGDHQNKGKPKKNETSKPAEDAAITLTVAAGQKINVGNVYETNLTWSLYNTPDGK